MLCSNFAPSLVLGIAMGALAAPLCGEMPGLGEFVVNPDVHDHSADFGGTFWPLPDAFMHADGSFAVVWQSQEADQTYKVYLRQYSSTGEALSEELPIAGGSGPVVAGAGDGLVVAWWTTRNPHRVLARLISDGSHLAPSGKLSLGDIVVGDGTAPMDVAGNPDGGFVVTWTDESTLWARGFSSGGEPLGEKVDIGDTNSNLRDHPQVAYLAGGGWVITRTAIDVLDGRASVFAHLLDATGRSLGDDVRVHDETAGSQRNASVAGLDDGGFVVAWEARSGYYADLYARTFAADGRPRSGELLIDAYTGDTLSDPVVASAGDFNARQK